MYTLALKEVSKTYPFDHTLIYALQKLSIQIEEGEFTALMGPSGSGKSTILNIMGGLDRPTQGSVFFHNKNLAQMGDRELSDFRNQHVGFVFQEPLLLPHLTVEENIMMPELFSVGRRPVNTTELIKEVGLQNRANHKPSELSGGQKQRACIARALIQNPSLVLADEPTGNLDSKTGREILELFKRLHASRGITFVIATHDHEIAKSAQRIVEVKDGKIG